MKKQTRARDQKLKINLEWPYHWDFVGYICSLVTTYVPSKCSNIIMSYTRQECTKTLFNIDMLLHQIVEYSHSLAMLTNVHANTHTHYAAGRSTSLVPRELYTMENTLFYSSSSTPSIRLIRHRSKPQPLS